jgi:MFS family permease
MDTLVVLRIRRYFREVPRVRVMKPEFLTSLTGDGRMLFCTRMVRLFAYGFLSVVLILYLVQVGLSETQIGLLLSLTLLGDTLISLWLTTIADRVGRRRVLIAGAILMVFAGLLFALVRNFYLLLVAATIGVISPSGYEVGPFLSVEQAALSHIIPDQHRTHAFAWYNLVGTFATALGALIGGVSVQAFEYLSLGSLTSYRAVVAGYAVFGLVMAILFARLSPSVEAAPIGLNPVSHLIPGSWFGLQRSRGIVLKLSALFSLDAFGGGFVIQSIVAYWFFVRFEVAPATLGAIFFGANILAGLSYLAAARVASRIGLIRTMVFTHIPSNILLILVPLMPNLPLAITVLLVRFSISQMDVPTRQSYTMAVVAPEERSAAAGITGIARTIGASLAPLFAGPMLASATLINVPFFLAGGLKLVYDLALYQSFKAIRPPEEP